jgi:hypothetical protein
MDHIHCWIKFFSIELFFAALGVLQYPPTFITNLLCYAMSHWNLGHVWFPPRHASARVLTMPVGLQYRLNASDRVMIAFGLRQAEAGASPRIQFVQAVGLRAAGRFKGWNWHFEVIIEARTRLVMIYDGYNNLILEVPLRRFTIRQFAQQDRMIEPLAIQEETDNDWTFAFLIPAGSLLIQEETENDAPPRPPIAWWGLPPSRAAMQSMADTETSASRSIGLRSDLVVDSEALDSEAFRVGTPVFMGVDPLLAIADSEALDSVVDCRSIAPRARGRRVRFNEVLHGPP